MAAQKLVRKTLICPVDGAALETEPGEDWCPCCDGCEVIAELVKGRPPSKLCEGGLHEQCDGCTCQCHHRPKTLP